MKYKQVHLDYFDNVEKMLNALNARESELLSLLNEPPSFTDYQREIYQNLIEGLLSEDNDLRRISRQAVVIHLISRIEPIYADGIRDTIKDSESYDKLDLTNYGLNNDLKLFKLLTYVIRDTKFNVVDLSENSLHLLSDQSLKLLHTALRHNPNLFLVTTSSYEDLPHFRYVDISSRIDIDKVLEENRIALLKQSGLKAQLELDKESKTYASDLYRLIDSLTQTLTRIPTIKDQAFQNMRYKLLSEIGNLYYNLFVYYAQQGNLQTAVETLLNITSDNPYYENARFDAFETCYNQYRMEGISQANAFIESLPCCLNENGKFIQFKPEFRKLIDSFLFAAAGFSESTPITLNEKDRTTFLKYIVLKQLQENSTGINLSLSSFFIDRMKGFSDFLTIRLQVIEPLQYPLQQAVQTAIEDIFDSALQRNNNRPLDKETTKLFKIVEDIERTEPNINFGNL